MTPIHEILSGWLAAAGLTPAQVAAKLPARHAGKASMSGWGLKLYLLGRTTPPGEVVRQIGEVCGRDRLEVAAAVLQAAGDHVTAGELRAALLHLSRDTELAVACALAQARKTLTEMRAGVEELRWRRSEGFESADSYAVNMDGFARAIKSTEDMIARLTVDAEVLARLAVRREVVS